MAAVICEMVDVEALGDGRMRRRCRRCAWETITAPGLSVNRRCGPPRLRIVGNALAAAGRAGAAAISGEPVRVDAPEQARRLEICRACDRWLGDRCALCGCIGRWKSWLQTERCPHPEGDRWG